MKVQKILETMIIVTMMLNMIGCDDGENQRIAEMAERNQERQVEQSRQIINLQHAIAEGSRRLVEADAQAREALIAQQREVQSERAEVGRQRDALEDERRLLATFRQLDPIIATVISSSATLLACMLPLVLAWYLLRVSSEPTGDQTVAEVLLEDFASANPHRLSRTDLVRGIKVPDEAGEMPRLPEDGDGVEPPF